MEYELQENDWAERMISEHTLGSNAYLTVCRVLRYYIDQGFDKKEAERRAAEFVRQCNTGLGPAKIDDLVEDAWKQAFRRPAIDVDCLNVSQTEMDKISVLSGYPAKRLAFTLLCFAKYCIIRNPKCDYWVGIPSNKIMKAANIKTSIKRQDELYSELHDTGLIRFSKKVDNINVRVNFVDDGESVIQVTTMKNLGYQYLMYIGKPYFECANCGVVTKLDHPENRRRQKYCHECAAKIITMRKVEALSKYRHHTENTNKSVQT